MTKEDVRWHKVILAISERESVQAKDKFTKSFFANQANQIKEAIKNGKSKTKNRKR